MSESKDKVFDIERYNKKIEEKCKVSDYILFKTEIPNTDFIGELEIIQGNDSSPYAPTSNYFLTYGILHELLQLYNNTKRETFNYFCKDILKRKETDISELKKIVSKKEKIKEEHILGFDFSYPDFILSDTTKKYSRGSDIVNFSSCYNNIKIPMKILNVFLLKNISKKSVFLIKAPCLISTVIVDYIKLLTYIFKEVQIFKLVQDSFFKDSFHLILTNPNLERYDKIKQEVKNSIKNNIGDINQAYIKNIIKYSLNNNNQEFVIKIKEFTIVLEILIATYMLNVIKALKTSIANNYRDPNVWKHLDFYFSKCL